jgi:hypothetical protein
MLLAEFKPAYMVRLHGAGDRLAWSPGPGTIPGEEPLLPRIETLLGALAAVAHEMGKACSTCDNWCRCVLEAAAELLGLTEAVVYGPFLVADSKVYVNVGTGLLELGALREWVSMAERVRKALNNSLPLERSQAIRKVNDTLESLQRGRLYIDDTKLVQREVSVTLNPHRKGAAYGLIYSQSSIDYRGTLGGDARISLLVEPLEDRSSTPDEGLVARIGVRHSYAEIRIKTIEAKATLPPFNTSSSHYAVVITPAPRTIIRCETTPAIHPITVKPRVIVHASSYSITGIFAKTRPEPRILPGTVVEADEGIGASCIHAVLRPSYIITEAQADTLKHILTSHQL